MPGTSSPLDGYLTFRLCLIPPCIDVLRTVSARRVKGWTNTLGRSGLVAAALRAGCGEVERPTTTPVAKLDAGGRRAAGEAWFYAGPGIDQLTMRFAPSSVEV